jgi:hypothetical protein
MPLSQSDRIKQSTFAITTVFARTEVTSVIASRGRTKQSSVANERDSSYYSEQAAQFHKKRLGLPRLSRNSGLPCSLRSPAMTFNPVSPGKVLRNKDVNLREKSEKKEEEYALQAFKR